MDNDSTDSEDTARLFPPSHTPSRSTSPLPQFYPVSDDDSDSEQPLTPQRTQPWRDHRRQWWPAPHRRPKRGSRALRVSKRWIRHLIRHPFFPNQPITIVLTLILFSVFAISLTLLLMYVLNPDKEPLPWRAYCSVPSLVPPFDRPLPPGSPRLYPNITHAQPIPPFPHAALDSLPPAGVFLGVFSIDSAFERRMLVRSTWASHPRSRNGAGDGDAGRGTSRTIVRFVLGQPHRDWERRVQLEMDTYNDIIILPMRENMNDGKTHTFFSWAALSAWVPPVYQQSAVPQPAFSYQNATSPPPPLASHDPVQAWQDVQTPHPKPWVRPDYVVKVDDDSFVMLAELEARLRLELHPTQHAQAASSSPSPSTSLAAPPEPHGDPLIFWGYLVTNRLHMFMAGELYALSWSLVDWVSTDPTVKTLTWGKEDKQTAKWMRAHPRRDEIRWTSERCWIYDHPRSGTVYAHGFLFPSEVARVRQAMAGDLARGAGTGKTLMSNGTAIVNSLGGSGSTPATWAHSSVSTFGVRYTLPLAGSAPAAHTVEALVEGSAMSRVRGSSSNSRSGGGGGGTGSGGAAFFPDWAWRHREGRRTRYAGERVGGTVVVHFVKKNMWYLETALALLEGVEVTEVERYAAGEGRAGGVGANAAVVVTAVADAAVVDAGAADSNVGTGTGIGVGAGHTPVPRRVQGLVGGHL